MIQILTDKVDSYLLFDSKLFSLHGEFTKWDNGKVLEIKFKITKGERSYQIEDVNFCVVHNRLEIHIFKNDNMIQDTFTATYKNLKGMSLKSKEIRNLDFIDYFKDPNPVLEDCYTPNQKGNGGIEPEVKKGNIVVGHP
ncbi:hypothetical protein [Flavivirga spongiicola]|uniref:Uncharacterized protein n=1 Tax=Flavivirga spongiicola TaxID=421621 RepID=A0ABU7XPA2_9FLAO|nr:hypothetical protein [Flavivirga sp. MEBiC05379]MDO5977590.1 hypothetical protein [Flavivirga sp. MEBiC05379]